jgi:hypothetical protein
VQHWTVLVQELLLYQHVHHLQMMMSGMTPTKHNCEDAKWIRTKQDDAGMTHCLEVE